MLCNNLQQMTSLKQRIFSDGFFVDALRVKLTYFLSLSSLIMRVTKAYMCNLKCNKVHTH